MPFTQYVTVGAATITSVTDPEPQGAASVWWSRSRIPMRRRLRQFSLI
jgi:hypothetical protein